MDRLAQMEREEAVLVIVDVQEVLMKQMNQEIGKNVIRNIKTLLAFSKEMAIPILITEQYPKGLGKTVPEIKMELRSILRLKSSPSVATERRRSKINWINWRGNRSSLPESKPMCVFYKQPTI